MKIEIVLLIAALTLSGCAYLPPTSSAPAAAPTSAEVSREIRKEIRRERTRQRMRRCASGGSCL